MTSDRNSTARFFRVMVIAGLSLVAIGLLVGLSPEQYFAWLDKPLLTCCRDAQHVERLIGPDWTLSAVRDVTALGSTIVLTIVTLCMIGLLLVSRLYRSAALFSVAATLGFVLMTLTKSSYGRVRPADLPQLDTVTGFSFPSGHAMMSTLIYLGIVVVLEEFLTREQKVFLALCCAFLAASVGVSRVMLGVHYPSDVLAGWLIGGGLSFCLAAAMRAFRRTSGI